MPAELTAVHENTLYTTKLDNEIKSNARNCSTILQTLLAHYERYYPTQAELENPNLDAAGKYLIIMATEWIAD